MGTLPLVAEGEELAAEGDYTDHRTYGRQFNVTNFTSRLPYSEDAILKYLASGIVRGIRAKTARTLIDNFGPETLNVIENEPDKIARLRGFSYERDVYKRQPHIFYMFV